MHQAITEFETEPPYPVIMLPDAYNWIERNGRAELTYGSYIVAIVSKHEGRAHVVIDCRMAWQQLQAREPSVATANKHIERWFAASLNGCVL